MSRGTKRKSEDECQAPNPKRLRTSSPNYTAYPNTHLSLDAPLNETVQLTNGINDISANASDSIVASDESTKKSNAKEMPPPQPIHQSAAQSAPANPTPQNHAATSANLSQTAKSQSSPPIVSVDRIATPVSDTQSNAPSSLSTNSDNRHNSTRENGTNANTSYDINHQSPVIANNRKSEESNNHNTLAVDSGVAMEDIIFTSQPSVPTQSSHNVYSQPPQHSYHHLSSSTQQPYPQSYHSQPYPQYLNNPFEVHMIKLPPEYRKAFENQSRQIKKQEIAALRQSIKQQYRESQQCLTAYHSQSHSQYSAPFYQQSAFINAGVPTSSLVSQPRRGWDDTTYSSAYRRDAKVGSESESGADDSSASHRYSDESSIAEEDDDIELADIEQMQMEEEHGVKDTKHVLLPKTETHRNDVSANIDTKCVEVIHNSESKHGSGIATNADFEIYHCNPLSSATNNSPPLTDNAAEAPQKALTKSVSVERSEQSVVNEDKHPSQKTQSPPPPTAATIDLLSATVSEECQTKPTDELTTAPPATVSAESEPSKCVTSAAMEDANATFSVNANDGPNLGSDEKQTDTPNALNNDGNTQSETERNLSTDIPDTGASSYPTPPLFPRSGVSSAAMVEFRHNVSSYMPIARPIVATNCDEPIELLSDTSDEEEALQPTEKVSPAPTPVADKKVDPGNEEQQQPLSSSAPPIDVSNADAEGEKAKEEIMNQDAEMKERNTEENPKEMQLSMATADANGTDTDVAMPDATQNKETETKTLNAETGAEETNTPNSTEEATEPAIADSQISGSTVFARYPVNSPKSIEVTIADMGRLRSGAYLNDNLIDLYMKYVYLEILNSEQRSRTHVFSSFFYKKLQSAIKNAKDSKQREKLSRWTRNVNVFEKDVLIIPVNEAYHWSLIIITKPGHINDAKLSDFEEVRSNSNPDDTIHSDGDQNMSSIDNNITVEPSEQIAAVAPESETNIETSPNHDSQPQSEANSADAPVHPPIVAMDIDDPHQCTDEATVDTAPNAATAPVEMALSENATAIDTNANNEQSTKLETTQPIKQLKTEPNTKRKFYIPITKLKNRLKYVSQSPLSPDSHDSGSVGAASNASANESKRTENTLPSTEADTKKRVTESATDGTAECEATVATAMSAEKEDKQSDIVITPDAETDVDTETKADIDTETKADVDTEAKTDVDVEANADVGVEANADDDNDETNSSSIGADIEAELEEKERIKTDEIMQSFVCKILHLDSLRGCHSDTDIAHNLREWLCDEWKRKHNSTDESAESERDFSENSIPQLSLKVSQQSNSCDCGVFMLHFAELFCQQSDWDHFDSVSAATQQRINEKRLEMKQLLIDMRKQQNLGYIDIDYQLKRLNVTVSSQCGSFIHDTFDRSALLRQYNSGVTVNANAAAAAVVAAYHPQQPYPHSHSHSHHHSHSHGYNRHLNNGLGAGMEESEEGTEDEESSDFEDDDLSVGELSGNRLRERVAEYDSELLLEAVLARCECDPSFNETMMEVFRCVEIADCNVASRVSEAKRAFQQTVMQQSRALQSMHARRTHSHSNTSPHHM